MIKIKILLFSLLTIWILTTCTNNANINNTNVNNTDFVLFSSAEGSHALNPEYFTLIFEENILVTWNDNAPSNLYDLEWAILDLRKFIQYGWFIDTLAYAPYQDDLIIAYVTTNLHSSQSNVARIDGDTLTPLWASDSFSSNMSSPIIKGSAIYFAAHGSIAKIHIPTGEIIWKHTSLYDSETSDFSSFRMPIFSDDKVIFQGDNIFSKCPKRIEVDDYSGNILRIVETCWP